MAAIDKTYFKSWEQFKEISDWCKDQGVVEFRGHKFSPYDYIPKIYEYDENFNVISTTEYTEEFVNDKLNEIALSNKEVYENSKEAMSYLEKERGCTITDQLLYEICKSSSEMFLWNTSTWFDVWLIQNCPIEWIQERLKQQYGGGWSKASFTNHNEDDLYEQIKNHTSIYDTYKRNGLGKKAKWYISYRYMTSRFTDDKMFWDISVYKPSDDDSKYGESYWYDSKSNYWFDNESLYIPKSESYSSTCFLEGKLTKRKISRLVRKWDLPKGTVIKVIGTYKRYLMNAFDITIK